MNSNQWQEEEVFFKGSDLFKSIFASIQNAKNSIEIEVYIFHTDALGNELLKHLAAASKKNVKVRLLIDAFGSRDCADEIKNALKDTNVNLKFYRPFHFQDIFWLLQRYNKRNHRKLYIIDNKLAYIGSMNVANNDWRELSVKVVGRDVTLLTESFNNIWDKSKRFIKVFNIDKIKSWGAKKLIFLNDTLIKRRLNYERLLTSIRHSTQKVWLANAYFLPQWRLLRALIFAAKRKIDVRILVPKKSDVFFMNYLTAICYQELLQAGIKIFEYTPSFLHVKLRIVDDFVIIGSSNLNNRSLLHDLEVDAQITHEQNILRLNQEFNNYLLDAEEITLKTFKKKPWWIRIFVRVLLLFSYWF